MSEDSAAAEMCNVEGSRVCFDVARAQHATSQGCARMQGTVMNKTTVPCGA